MRTLLLDQDAWDLVEDASGNIALADAPYALAQDVASEIRTFQGEVYYDTTRGIPYFDQVLGHLPPSSVLVQYINKAALLVPGVIAPQTSIKSFINDNVTGQVQFTDPTGESHVATF